ncbi:MAG: sensor domain-containing protein [Mycobacterium sp.]|nr:sensor domain-containing protein [Mycobacterium sp.]
MGQLFISYARENKPDVEALIRDLDALGYQTWVDSSLRGGQTWWEEILRRIAESDVFVAIVSAHTLNSVACKRELEWALALDKPVLPVAVERLAQALPLTLSMRQIVNYSKPGKEAAFALAGALGTLPAQPPASEQLPEPPPAPLSYLWDLVERMGQPQPLTHTQQHQILIQLQPALRSADPEERESGRYVLKMFSRRDDLYADVDRTRAQLELADHLDVAARVEQAARTAQRRKALVDEMTALHQTGQWDAVVAAAQELAGLDPEHPDPGGIVSDAQAKIRDAQLAEQYAQAWAQAADPFSAIEQEQPGYRDAPALLKTAEQQRHLAAWLDQAEAAAGHDDWDTAVTALENLCAVDPGYRDAGARLEQARSARSVKQRRSLVDEMTELHQAGRWKEVLAAAEKLAQLDPDHPDPGGIVSDAQAKIRDQLAEQYAQALNHLDQQHWQQAAEVFTAIEQEQPGYRDATSLLKTAQQNLSETAVAKQRATTPAQPPPQTTTPAAPEKTTPYPQKTTPSPAEKKAAPAALEAPEAQSASLTHEQQREIIDRLQRALISADPQNRQVARHLLDRFRGRQDLYQDISQTVAQWRTELPTIQGVQRPYPPQVPKAARYSGLVTPLRRSPSIPVVVAVATVIVAAVLVGVLIARGSGSIPTPTTSEIIAPTTSESPVDTSSPAINNAVAEDALKGFLLSPEQINATMGATEMKVTKSRVAMSDDSATMEPKECLAIDGSAQAHVYAGSNFMAERDQTLQGGDNLTLFAEQAVVLFPSAKQADAFFTASAQQWPACHQYTRIQSKTRWTVGAISNTNGTLSTTATQQNANGPGWGCGRALAARNNVVIDVTTCSANPADAVTIANWIAAKVPI